VLWREVKLDKGNIPVPVEAGGVNVVDRAKQAEYIKQRLNNGAENVALKKPGAEYANCGAPKTCADDEFSVHLYTGTQNKDVPKICVDGS